MDLAIIGLLGTALFSVVTLLGTQMASLRADLRENTRQLGEVRSELGDVRQELGSLTAEVRFLRERFDSHMVEHHGSVA